MEGCAQDTIYSNKCRSSGDVPVLPGQRNPLAACQHLNSRGPKTSFGGVPLLPTATTLSSSDFVSLAVPACEPGANHPNDPVVIEEGVALLLPTVVLFPLPLPLPLPLLLSVVCCTRFEVSRPKMWNNSNLCGGKSTSSRRSSSSSLSSLLSSLPSLLLSLTSLL